MVVVVTTNCYSGDNDGDVDSNEVIVMTEVMVVVVMVEGGGGDNNGDDGDDKIYHCQTWKICFFKLKLNSQNLFFWF